MSDVDRGRRRAATAFLLASTATATIALATSLWLTFAYQPPASGVFGRGGEAGGTRRLSEINEATLGVLSGLALVLAIAGIVPSVREAFRLSWRTAVAGAVALAATWLAGMTRSLLEWDQLAVWAVTVDSDLRGYWAGAFGEDVRFALVDLTEVERSTYAVSLAAHLTALVGVLAAFALASLDVRRRRSGDQNSRSSLDSMPLSSS